MMKGFWGVVGWCFPPGEPTVDRAGVGSCALLLETSQVREMIEKVSSDGVTNWWRALDDS